MYLRMKRLFVISILLCVVLALLAPGCGQAAPSTGYDPSLVQPTESEIDPAYAIDVQLIILDIQGLNQPAQLTATFSIMEGYNGDAPNTMVEIILPKGYELVEGDLKRTVDIMRGAPAEMQVTVKVVEPGEWWVIGKATCSPGAEPCVGGHNTIITDVK